jgi:recombination protein RecT
MSNLPALKSLTEYVEKGSDSIKKSLPAGMSVEKFINTANNAIMTHPQRDKLLEADRLSIFNACKKAAGDGLLLDGREAAMVVYNTKQGNSWVPTAQYIPMTQGLVKLARNSGEIKSIIAEVVYENDKFVYRIGIDEMPTHEPDWFGDRGKAIGVWACVKLKDGEVISRMLPKTKIMNIAEGSKTNAKQYSPTEGQYFDEWWRKAAIKNVLKYAPKTTELEKLNQVIGVDNDAHFDFSQEHVEVEPPVEKTVQKETKAAKVIKEESTKDVDVIDVEIIEEQDEENESPI